MLGIYIGYREGETSYLALPAYGKEIEKAIKVLQKNEEDNDLKIYEMDASVPHLKEYINGLSFEKENVGRDLDFLAERIENLSQKEQAIFSAILEMEQPKDLMELINLSFHLSNYELIQGYANQKELARLLIKREKGIEIPEELTPILDEKATLEPWFLQHKGAFCSEGLVRKKDDVVTETVYDRTKYMSPGYEKDGLFLLCLESKKCRNSCKHYYLSFPAIEERMELARKKLRVDTLNECIFWDCSESWDSIFNYLPAGCSPEELNQVAQILQKEVLDGSEEKLSYLKAVLEAECPETREEVISVIENLTDYEWISEGAAMDEDFVHHVLRDSPYYLDAFLEQFIDMEGLSKALMEEKGARKTMHGIVICEKWRCEKLSKEITTTHLLNPLEGGYYEKTGGGLSEPPLILDGADLLFYEAQIQEELKRVNGCREEGSDLAKYLHNYLLRQKVVSMQPGVKAVEGRLYGMLTVKSKGELTPQELDRVIEDWTGQASDGWGESFEQQEIDAGYGILYVSFWQNDDSYQILPEEQFLETQKNSSQIGERQMHSIS